MTSAATSSQKCGKDFGAGWAMAWNDPADPGYLIHDKGNTIGVGSNTTANGNVKDRTVHYDSSAPCGAYGSPITGQWGTAGTATHIYASAKALPIRGTTPGSGICTVNYVLKTNPPRNRQLNAKRNKNNSFRAAGGTLTSTDCINPLALKADPTIVTTSTNAQVGSAITDAATLSGTSQDLTKGTGKKNPH